MLTKIVVEGPASFKKRSEIETDKKVNLIYGLNGTGKSTIGRFLQSPDDDAYAACEVHGDLSGKIFVFNEEFIQQNFYESEEIKGIFSLSKENKTAEAKIAEATQERAKQIDERNKVELIYQEKERNLQAEKARLLDKVFDIKREHSGGDRVLEFCLEGVMGNKERLLERLIGISKPELQPAYSGRKGTEGVK